MEHLIAHPCYAARCQVKGKTHYEFKKGKSVWAEIIVPISYKKGQSVLFNYKRGEQILRENELPKWFEALYRETLRIRSEQLKIRNMLR